MKDINKSGFVIVIGDCFFKNKKHSYDNDVVGDLRFAKVFKTREKAQKKIDDHPTWVCRIEPISEFLVVGYTLIDNKVEEIDCFKTIHSPTHFDLYATIGKKMRGWDGQ